MISFYLATFINEKHSFQSRINDWYKIIYAFYWFIWSPTQEGTDDLNHVIKIAHRQWPIIVRICLAGRGDGNLPDTDLVVRVTSKKSLAISGPSHRQTLGWSSLG